MRTLDDVPLAPAEREAIEAAAAALRARFPVTDIVLFGSKARGDSDPESDIDLLVLTSRPLDAEEQRRIWGELHDIGMRFDVLLSPLTVEARSWREGMHSVLPIHAEVEREGARYLGHNDEAPAHRTLPPSGQVPSSAASREALVKQVVAEWMTRAEEALASGGAELDAGRYSFTINRAYYAAFYAVSAVLLKQGRHFVKHAGVRAAMHRDLVHEGLLTLEHGKAYDALFELRLVADYTVAGVDADQATRSLGQVEAIVAEMRRLLAAEGWTRVIEL
jgi:uncharacterized protein (UPF0332 family)/predicted nucleotidyltransferase